MKKTRFLALVLVVAIALMGAGYALWTDEIKLTSTVKTGKFDMEVKTASIRSGDMEKENEKFGWHSYDWTHGKYPIIKTKDSVEVSFTDLYPGGSVRIDVVARNNGTLPARLKNIVVKRIGGEKDLFNLLISKTDFNANIDGTLDSENKLPYTNYTKSDGKWRTIQETMDKLVKDAEHIVIEPNGEFKVDSLMIKLDPIAKNILQEKECKFEITFNWEQWSSDPTLRPYEGYGGDGDIPGIELKK